MAPDAVSVVEVPVHTLLKVAAAVTFGSAFTVNVAAFEFAAVVQLVFATSKRYWYPLMDAAAGLIASVPVVAPE